MKSSLYVNKVTCYRGYDEQQDGEVLLDEFTLHDLSKAHHTTLILTVRDTSDEAAYFLNALEKHHVVELDLHEPLLPPTLGERVYKENTV